MAFPDISCNRVLGVSTMKVVMVDSLVGNDYSICLCSGLDAADADITLIVPENRVIGFPVNFTVRYWAPTKEPGFSKIRKTIKYIKFLLDLFVFIKQSHTDIVHFQFFRRERIESFYFLLLRLLGFNLIVTAHNVLPHQKRKIDHLLKYIVYRSAGAIVAHSKYIQDQITALFKITRTKIHIIPHGDFDIYLPQQPLSKHEAKKKFKLSKKDNVLLFFGSIRENKGLDLLLDAFQIAAEADEHLKLIIAGKPLTAKLENRYRSKISGIRSRDRIIFHSHFISNESVADYFIASDIVVLPYKSIYHSGIVHLAFSFGKPIIATRVGDFDETIENGKSGYLLDKNSASDLAEMIAMGFSNAEKLEHMGKFVRKLSETKYSWDHIARRTKGLYEKVVKAT